MIVAVGLSPAWQQVLVVERLHPGAVNRAVEAYWCASGKVLNAGVALRRLSGDVPEQTLILSTLGGPAYDAIDDELAALDVPRRWIRTQSPTRVCTTLVDRSTGVATELVENAGPINAAELAEFTAAFVEVASAASVAVLTGSLPEGAPADYYRQLLAAYPGRAIVDASGPALLAALQARPWVVKPNRDELGRTLGQPIADDEDLRRAMGELHRRGAHAVVVTGGKDDVWLSVEGRFTRLPTEPVERPINPIGCGDCLAAGLAWALSDGSDLPAAVERGIACAAANLRTLLPSDFDGRRQHQQRR